MVTALVRLEVGRIAKPHGLRGEVVVQMLDDRPERLRPGATFEAGGRRLDVVESRPHQGRHLVRFAGVDDRDAAEALRGVSLEAEAHADPDLLWVHELIGSRCVELDGTERGRVVSVIDNPAADLLELDSGALVPLSFLVSHDEGVVTIDPPAGLFD
jgi:16S rRNA processing protein RimM